VPVKVLFDPDVVLDVLLDRAPHIDVAAKLFAFVGNGRLEGSICAATVTTSETRLSRCSTRMSCSQRSQPRPTRALGAPFPTTTSSGLRRACRYLNNGEAATFTRGYLVSRAS
jgi:hypothetical protein